MYGAWRPFLLSYWGQSINFDRDNFQGTLTWIKTVEVNASKRLKAARNTLQWKHKHFPAWPFYFRFWSRKYKLWWAAFWSLHLNQYLQNFNACAKCHIQDGRSQAYIFLFLLSPAQVKIRGNFVVPFRHRELSSKADSGQESLISDHQRFRELILCQIQVNVSVPSVGSMMFPEIWHRWRRRLWRER